MRQHNWQKKKHNKHNNKFKCEIKQILNKHRKYNHSCTVHPKSSAQIGSPFFERATTMRWQEQRNKHVRFMVSCYFWNVDFFICLFLLAYARACHWLKLPIFFIFFIKNNIFNEFFATKKKPTWIKKLGRNMKTDTHTKARMAMISLDTVMSNAVVRMPYFFSSKG